MPEEELKLGDWVDDYCTRCRLVMNHFIVSLVNGEIVKVRCQTCNYEHDFRHGKEGKKKKDSRKALFDQVAASLPSFGTPPPAPKKSGGRKS
jgi:hypothetical protein